MVEALVLLGGMDLARFTRNTITSLRGLENELSEIHARGYGVDDEKHEEGVGCIAAPIFENAGLVAVASIAGPGDRIREGLDGGKLAEALMATAAEVSGRMGCTAIPPAIGGLSQERGLTDHEAATSPRVRRPL